MSAFHRCLRRIVLALGKGFGLRSEGIRLETERLLIRPFSEKDAQDLHEYLSDPSVYAYEPGSPIDPRRAMKLTEERARGSDFFAVELKEGGKMIGHLYFKRQKPEDRMSWELGYILNPRFYRRGYATEAARAILGYAFEELGAHRVMARCDPRNEASWRLLERIGFRREGHFRRFAFFRRDDTGKPLWHDAYEYAILDEDYDREVGR